MKKGVSSKLFSRKYLKIEFKLFWIIREPCNFKIVIRIINGNPTMNEYDLLILSPNEFENISRDLLQEKFGVFIESFTTGSDGGIDLRFAKDNSGNVIIQAKRYKDYSALINNLTKEQVKVIKLNPSRYILTTSVPLTPNNKEVIKLLFFPFIRSTEDILGKSDLNNLISLFGNIEHKYYKLWLSSTNILHKVIHSKIYNQTAFQLESIHEQVKLYVQNDSFTEAIDILKNNKYVIISGLPGIGKTTLSRIIVLYLLANDFEEFVFLSDSIDDGYEYFVEGKKQIFFFDDFLGKNFFEGRRLINEDNKIVQFIEKVKRSPDKLLILSTREYILNQAKFSYESFKINNIEIAKCILDLSSYTNIVKAQILYNHLFFANVPTAHIENLFVKSIYLNLVNHPNFNPRIIETVINQKIWEYCLPEQFGVVLLSYFDNPESVWLYAFENSLDTFSQHSLLVLLTMGTPALIEDWESAINHYFLLHNYKLMVSFDSFTFNKSIRVLENTFIRTQKDSYTTVAVEYQNPSIQDFLINYIRGKNELIKSIIEASIFTNQFFRIFTTDLTINESNKRKIVLNSRLINASIQRINSIFDKIRCSRLYRAKYMVHDDTFHWRSDNTFIFRFLNDVRIQFFSLDSASHDLVYTNLNNIVISLEDDYYAGDYYEQEAFIELMEYLSSSKFTFDEDKLLLDFSGQLHFVSNILLFYRFRSVFPTSFNIVINQDSFVAMVQEVVKSEVTSVADDDINNLKSEINSIESKYGISLQNEYEDLLEKERESNEELGSLDSISLAVPDISINWVSKDSEEEQIKQIFKSLMD